MNAQTVSRACPSAYFSSESTESIPIKFSSGEFGPHQQLLGEFNFRSYRSKQYKPYFTQSSVTSNFLSTFLRYYLCISMRSTSFFLKYFSMW